MCTARWRWLGCLFALSLFPGLQAAPLQLYTEEYPPLNFARDGRPVYVRDVANVVLSYAADSDAQFIVMGGYGHSRLREYILGGATRGILGSMTVPVLMSH